MSDVIAKIIRETGADSCVACGKCSAACSMASMYPDFSADFSPRGIVQATLRKAAGQGDGAPEELLWRCLQCGNCSQACPERIACSCLIAKLRGHIAEAAERNSCVNCGREIPSLPVKEWLSQTLDPDGRAMAPDDDDQNGSRNTAYLNLCPVCRREVYAANNTAG